MDGGWAGGRRLGLGTRGGISWGLGRRGREGCGAGAGEGAWDGGGVGRVNRRRLRWSGGWATGSEDVKAAVLGFGWDVVESRSFQNGLWVRNWTVVIMVVMERTAVIT